MPLGGSPGFIVAHFAEKNAAAGMHGNDRGASGAIVGADDERTAEQPFALQRQAGAGQGVVFSGRVVFQYLEDGRQRLLQALQCKGIKRGSQSLRLWPGRIQQMVGHNVAARLQGLRLGLRGPVSHVAGGIQVAHDQIEPVIGGTCIVYALRIRCG